MARIGSGGLRFGVGGQCIDSGWLGRVVSGGVQRKC
jgi:hypothetical protein